MDEMTGYGTQRRPVTFESLVEDMLPRLPGANPPYVRKALHDKLNELCVQTHCWVETAEAVTLEEGERTYPIPVAYDAHILCVRKALKNGRPMWKGEYAVDLSDADSPVCTLRSAPQKGITGELSFETALAPLPRCENFPDGFLERYRLTLVAGTLFELQAEEGKPYSRAQEAQLNFKKWQDGLYECNVSRLAGDTVTDSSVLTAREAFI